MKVCVLTTSTDVADGWGRYAAGLVESLQAQGVEVVTITQELPNPLTYRVYFLAWWYAWRLRTRARDCDLIHAFVEPYAYIAYCLACVTGRRYLITAHGTWSVLPYGLSAPKKHLHTKAFANATAVICVSDYTKRRLEHFGLSNLVVINNGINFERFHQMATTIARENHIVSVGALNPAKGYHVALRAFAQVVAVVPSATYRIIGNQGNAAYVTVLRRLAVELGISGAVTFAENVSHQELLAAYHQAAVFMLLPVNRGFDFEGFGLVYLEAGACGLPVVGSRDSGAEDAIRNGVTGFLVAQNDPQRTADAVVRILRDGPLAARLATGGVEWAKAHDWGIIATRYLALYTRQI